MILSPTVTYTPPQMPFPGEDQPDPLDVEVVEEAEVDEEQEVEAITVEASVVVARAGEEGETDVLADVTPATDAEIDAIEAQVVKKAATREKSSRALALRDPMAAYMSALLDSRALSGRPAPCTEASATLRKPSICCCTNRTTRVKPIAAMTNMCPSGTSP